MRDFASISKSTNEMKKITSDGKVVQFNDDDDDAEIFTEDFFIQLDKSGKDPIESLSSEVALGL